jgi:osmotically inducible protein OsmC
MLPSVVYTREGDVHSFETGVPGLEKITIDYTEVPAEERNGLAKQLLACSLLSCYGSMLATALDVRGAEVSSIVGKATPEFGKSETGQARVTKMNLEFTVHLPEEDIDIFERCEKIMKKGCLLTGSIHEGIEMSYDLKPVYEE